MPGGILAPPVSVKNPATAVAWAVLLALLVSERAAAQSGPIDEVRKGYRIHVGGLYLDPSLALTELGMDSNVFNETGARRSDFVLTLTPRLNVAVPIARRALVKATFGTGFTYFTRFASERSVDPQATLRGEIYARRITPFVEAGYVNSRQRVNLELDARERRRQRTLAGGVIVRVTPKLAVHLVERYGETRFGEDAIFLGQRLRETLNGVSRAFAVSTRRDLTALTAVSIDYERQQDVFPHARERDTTSFRVMPGVTFKPRALISGTARVGYRRFTPVDPRLRSQAGLVSALELSYTLRGATVFRATFDRDVYFSYSALSPYFVDNGVGFSIRRAMGPHFDVIAEAVRHRYDYERLAGAVADPRAPDSSETTDRLGVSLGYRLRRQTRIGFGVTYTERRAATQAIRRYSGLRLTTTISSGLTR